MNRNKRKTIRERKLEKPWTPEEDRLLVRLVEERDVLWDSGCPDYKRREKRDDCWAVIASKTNHTVSDTKIHWNSIRSRFNVVRRKVLDSIERGDKTIHEPTFSHYKSLHFLLKLEALPKLSVLKNKTIAREWSDVSTCSQSQPATDNSMTIKNESLYESEYLSSPPASPCTSSSMNFEGYPEISVLDLKKEQEKLVDSKQSFQRTVLMEEITNFLRNQQEVQKETKWKKSFGELIFHELNRYNEKDAQDLKKQLLILCLNFKPTEEDQKMIVESSEHT